jgi:hypothetical protein
MVGTSCVHTTHCCEKLGKKKNEEVAGETTFVDTLKELEAARK